MQHTHVCPRASVENTDGCKLSCSLIPLHSRISGRIVIANKHAVKMSTLICAVELTACVLCSAVNGSLNATSKAAIISASVNGSTPSAVPGAGYGVYGNQPGFLSGFTQQPTQWFNASSIYDETDPPGGKQYHLLVCTQSCKHRHTH